MKRAAIRAVKGLAAFETLLTGAKKVPSSSKYYRLYEKNGGISTALNDINSIDPVLTAQKQRYGWKPRVLLVGDWRFILKPHGDRYSVRSPVLEIRSTDVLYDRIVYKVEK